jgi:hypothetical protein
VWKDKQGWIMTAKAAMKELWESQYKPTAQATPISVTELAAESQRKKDSNLVEHTFAWQHEEEQQHRRKKPRIEDQYDTYINSDTVKRGEVKNLIEWWSDRAAIWPDLSRLPWTPYLYLQCRQSANDASVIVADSSLTNEAV